MKDDQQTAVAGLVLTAPNDVRSMPMTGTGFLSDGMAACDAGDGVRCALPDGVLRPVGIVMFQNIGKSGKGLDGKEAYQQFDVVPVLRVGRVWVHSTAPIMETGGAVYVRTANADALHPLGSLQPTAADGTVLVGATWDSLTSADGFALVQLRGA